ncbi:hypothetical protein KFL_001740140 [Klebsormidium nitens]|uniref:Uncharacterized protein n=1 Tax=Klebsormidium nitens TaxID=105231 RepID=A0A1Y1HZH7_KLENI|nr:hypothetical protein KFL_001740140 [Klebsormidium nitens]|eukprot:GAQ84055.1 hypothetical protein KFL_001740140 [Klebsormidium nitens]
MGLETPRGEGDGEGATISFRLRRRKYGRYVLDHSVEPGPHARFLRREQPSSNSTGGLKKEASEPKNQSAAYKVMGRNLEESAMEQPLLPREGL